MVEKNFNPYLPTSPKQPTELTKLNREIKERIAQNFIPKKIRYVRSKRRGIVLTRTYYQTTYVCDICGRSVNTAFEKTKNNDIKLRCNDCVQVQRKLLERLDLETIEALIEEKKKATQLSPRKLHEYNVEKLTNICMAKPDFFVKIIGILKGKGLVK